MYQFKIEELIGMLEEYSCAHGYHYIYSITEGKDGRALNVYFYGSERYLSKDVTIFYNNTTELSQLWLVL